MKSSADWTFALLEALKGSGLSAWGIVPRVFLKKAVGGLPTAMSDKYDLGASGGVVATSLRYGEGFFAAPAWATVYNGPSLSIARFARANWYAELAIRLRSVIARTRVRLLAAGQDPGPAGTWRYAVNSGLPEKPFALASGLGCLGRNGLVLGGGDTSEGGGPGLVLGLLLLPFAPLEEVETAQPPEEHFLPGGLCGSCHSCVEACPTRALTPSSGFDRELCLQYWTAREGVLPGAVRAAWGARLYGCDACIESCPRFQADPEAQTEVGLLGPHLPARFFLEASDEELRSRLRGTALGMRWMSHEAFRRSARLALGI